MKKLNFESARTTHAQEKPWLPLETDVQRGFSDELLEDLCSTATLSRDQAIYGGVPAHHWSQEIYSFGRCCREVSGWPRFLPIPVSLDHGVPFGTELSQHEREFPSFGHIAWSEWKPPKTKRFSAGKVIFHTENPWVTYRRKCWPNPSPNARGALIFVPHSLPGHDRIDNSIADLIEFAVSLSNEYQPRAIMIAMHDVHLGLHRDLRHYGLPILSAGHSSSPFFVDRFYSIIREFQTGLGTSVGSQSFYMEEMGLHYLIHGDGLELPPSVQKAIGQEGIEIFRECNEVFRRVEKHHDSAKRGLLTQGLGLGYSSTAAKIWFIFMGNLPGYIIRAGFREVFYKLRKLARGGRNENS